MRKESAPLPSPGSAAAIPVAASGDVLPSVQGRDCRPPAAGKRRPSRKTSWAASAARLVLWTVLVCAAFKVAAAVKATLELPPAARALALGGEALLAAAAAVWAFRLCRAFGALSASRQWDSNGPRENRIGLARYYKGILDSPTALENLREQLGGDDEDWRRTKAELERISDPGSVRNPDWPARQRAFDDRIAERAGRIAREHAVLTAIKTATSPWKAVDVLAVFYNGTATVERIAKLYGRRCSGPQAFRLACSWAWNLYVAGRIGEISEKGAAIGVDAAAQAIETSGGGLSWLAKVLPVAGALFAKAGEGAVNYYFCRRLGSRAVEFFRPVSGNRTGS